jgi:hypothetical protein
MSREQQRGKRDRRLRAPSRCDQRRRREDQHTNHIHRIRSSNRDRLHHQRKRHDRLADRIPRKTCKDKAAQPFGKPEGCCERQQPHKPVRPEKPGKRSRQPIEQCEIGGQPDDRERQRPGEFIGVDQQRIADPPQPSHEIAKPERPADQKGGKQPDEQIAVGIAGGAVEKPDEQRKGNEADQENTDGRQRQRGEGAGNQGDEEAFRP